MSASQELQIYLGRETWPRAALQPSVRKETIVIQAFQAHVDPAPHLQHRLGASGRLSLFFQLVHFLQHLILFPVTVLSLVMMTGLLCYLCF